MARASDTRAVDVFPAGRGVHLTASTHPIRSLSAKDAPLVERLRKICLSLPEANEKISHGEPTWFAGKGKVFAMLDNHHHGSTHLGVWLPQPMGAQEALLDADPARFFRPPYVGASGWVGVILDTKPDWAMVAAMVRDAYLHIATSKLRERVTASTSAAAIGKGNPAPSRVRRRATTGKHR